MAQIHEHLTTEQEECLRGCGSQEYYNIMRTHFENGTCPFCNINHSLHKIVFQHERWLGWRVPSKATTREPTCELQFVFFPKQFGGKCPELRDLSRDHHADLSDIMEWMYQRFEMPGGGLAGRFGHSLWNVGTVPVHFHWNLYVPNRKGAVMVPFAKDQKTIDAHTRQMIGFKEDFDLRMGNG